MKRVLCIFLCLILISATACGKKKTGASTQQGTSSGETEHSSQGGTVEQITAPTVDLDFSAKDGDASYDSDAATTITFSDKSASVNGEGATAEGTKVAIDEAGTYILSGKCTDGKITVNLTKNDKVKLVLDRLTLTCKDGAALVVTEGDKVFLTLADGSENSLTDGASYTETVGETNVDGTIFSRADFCINGSGTLTVKANNKHGIVSKDDLVLSGEGKLTVDAAGVGLEGKDCVKIREMSVGVTSEGDGIRSTNTEDTDRGFVYIQSGKIRIKTQGDGISAETLLQIDGGDIDIQTGEGADAAPEKQDNMMGGGFRPGGSTTTTEEDEVSRKGLKCTASLLIKGGTITLDAYDDGIHSDGDVGMADGKVSLKSGDDGIHAENILEIAGGSLSVVKSYEGLEACKIYIKGGNVSVVSSDDGLNASDGSGSMGMGGFGGMMGGSSEAYLAISGGYLFVNAAGDGLDSNGNFDMQGGIVLVSGPTNGGNGALDYGEGCAATVSGGILIAVGAQGMAENFSNANGQGAMLVSTGTCQAGTSLAVCDSDGKVLASFTPPKAYQCAVITAPGIQTGKTYTIHTGATVKNADGNGFAEGSTLSGGSKAATVEMTSLLYGGGMGMGGGGMQPGGGGGMKPGGGGRPGRM